MNRSTKRFWLIGLVACVVALPVVLRAIPPESWANRPKPRQYICETWRDELWSPGRNACITSACYATQSCGLYAYPAARCDRLRLGDDIARVHLMLGDPMQITGNESTWHWHKAEPGVGVTATFAQDKLVALDCPAAP